MSHNPPSSCLAFDHLVIMLRDEIEARAPDFEAAGFRLSAPGVHNLGSLNRLIVLDSSYIELLGWPAGETPRRKEIADQAMGLDALVLRSEDAERDRQRLQDAGFRVNPVSRLERPLNFNGQPQIARLDTVRFSIPPIAGIRLYFCQHLTPQYVWDEALQDHPNGARALHRIHITAPDAAQTAQILATLAAGTAVLRDGQYRVVLPNTELVVHSDPQASTARILWVELLHADGVARRFDSGLG